MTVVVGGNEVKNFTVNQRSDTSFCCQVSNSFIELTSAVLNYLVS